METSDQDTRLQHLSPDILKHVAVLLSDPGPLAATCHATATLLDQDTLLLAWAEVWVPRLADSALGAQHRHPGYALLHWRRLCLMSTPRLAGLLLQWVGRRSLLPSSIRAQQLLAAGDATAALQALLPYSEHLLLLYVAQTGHVQLLADLLAAPDVLKTAQLRCRSKEQPDEIKQIVYEHHVLRSALHAAARNGRVAAMQALLAALQHSGDSSGAQGALETAVRAGSRGGPCVVALAQLGKGHVANTAWVERSELLEAAVAGGDGSAVAALMESGLAAAPDRSTLSYLHALAMCCGHVQLLPLLRPADMTEAEASKHVCRAASAATAGDVSAGVLALLPAAIRTQLGLPGRQQTSMGDMEQAVSALLSSSSFSLPTLQTQWAGLTAQHRAALAHHVWRSLTFNAHEPSAEVARWAVQCALPYLTEGPGHGGGMLQQQAALNALRRGHKALLQAPSATSELVSSSAAWQQAQVAGQLLRAVRSGDVALVQAGVQLLGAGFNGLNVLKDAMQAAAALTDPAAAEAVAHVLAPHLSPSQQHRILSLRDEVLFTHGRRLLRVLHEHCGEIRHNTVGPQAQPQVGVHALEHGHIDAAAWLASHPNQGEDYLHSVVMGEHRCHLTPAMAAGLTALLHRLAAPPATAIENTEHSSGSASDDDGEQGRSTSRQPPAGLRQLTVPLLAGLLEQGCPDLVHALLVYMNSWGLLLAGSGSAHEIGS